MPGRSTLITSAPNQASNWVQVGPDWTCVKSRIFTPSSALPSLPQGLLDIFGRLLALAFLAALATTLAVGLALALALALTFFSAFSLSLRLAFFSLSFFFAMVVLRSLEWGGKPEVRASLGAYFLRSLLCGLRLPMRPLSAPAAGSMTALIRVGLRESMAVLTARFS